MSEAERWRLFLTAIYDCTHDRWRSSYRDKHTLLAKIESVTWLSRIGCAPGQINTPTINYAALAEEIKAWSNKQR